LFDPRRPAVRVLTRSANAVSLQIQIAPESPYFDGHFPGAPILPGVAQLDWVALFAREFFVLPPTFQRLEVVKFQQIITPGMVIDMALAVDAERGRLSFALTSVTGSHASGRFIFGVAA
jgi:3-hydroxymyristoyl/3-hydroxydecanoyl-(acyl carrier protein) dehydratase